MPISLLRNTNNMKDQASVFSPKPTSPVEMLASENFLDEPQYREIKKNINSLKDLKKTYKESSVKSRRKIIIRINA